MLFTDYAFANNLATSIISVIYVANIKSRRVAEKNGLKIDKLTKWFDDEDVYIYRIIIEKVCNFVKLPVYTLSGMVSFIV